MKHRPSSYAQSRDTPIDDCHISALSSAPIPQLPSTVRTQSHRWFGYYIISLGKIFAKTVTETDIVISGQEIGELSGQADRFLVDVTANKLLKR
jgi:hypothetical protein